jgi:anaerobic selenocysteine-containing dehydrogenase
MCHESSGWGLSQTLGVGKSTVTLSDLEHAELIFSIGQIGQNPGTNHPRMLTSLLAAERNGVTIIDVNPLPEVGLLRFKHPQEPMHLLDAGTRLSDRLLEGRSPGTVLDWDFIHGHTSGFEEFCEHVRSTDWAVIEEQSGIARARTVEVGEIAAKARSTVICWAMGWTQHRKGAENIREIVNLLVLRGNIGKANSGVLCVRGQTAGPQFTTVEDTQGVVSSSRGVLAPVSGNVKSEVAIIAGIAAATVSGKGDVNWMNFLDYDQIRDRASRAVAGFEKFNERGRVPWWILCSGGCETAAVRDGHGQGELHNQPDSPASTRGRSMPDDDYSLARPIQHDYLWFG